MVWGLVTQQALYYRWGGSLRFGAWVRGAGGMRPTPPFGGGGGGGVAGGDPILFVLPCCLMHPSQAPFQVKAPHPPSPPPTHNQ